jgi:hypothetical protein
VAGFCSAAAMIDDDENFMVDADGNRVLIGLTVEETLEFDRLERHINKTGPFPHISRDEWHRSEEKRWLELWDQHQAAMVEFLRTKTRH